MTGAAVSVYNDDKHGRAVHVVKLNLSSWECSEHTVLDACEEPAPLAMELHEHEILIITRATE